MKKSDSENNLAFIDGQNLYLGTKSSALPWNIDLNKFRIYLKRKYNISKAYYFLGYVINDNDILYDKIQNAGFILKFRKHNTAMLGIKKGNVDSDIIFNIMKKLYKKEEFNKIIIVSGDGDYKMLIDFLITENKFKKILFPNKKYASSLYKKMHKKYFNSLDNPGIKKKIMRALLR